MDPEWGPDWDKKEESINNQPLEEYTVIDGGMNEVLVDSWYSFIKEGVPLWSSYKGT